MLAPVSMVGRNLRGASWGASPAASPREDGAVLGLETHGLQAITVRAGRNEEIVRQGAPAGSCHFVLSGCLRTVRLLEDGRRQLGEFLFPGDLFGWEALDSHRFGLEAINAATLLRYSQFRLQALAACDPRLAERLRALAAGQVRANRERLVLLGRKTAAERVATFLLEMASRLPERGSGSIELPMSRTDIADYLGLTIETVCRTITSLRKRGFIVVDRTRTTIGDRRALESESCESFA